MSIDSNFLPYPPIGRCQQTQGLTNAKTSEVTLSTAPSKFNFEELQDIFIEKGLNALIAKLQELNIADIKVNTDAQTGKTTVTATIDGVEYLFTGTKSDTVTDTQGSANSGSTVPSTTGGSNLSVEDLKNIEAYWNKNFLSSPSLVKAQSDITRRVSQSDDESMLSTTFMGGYEEGDSISLIEYEGMRKLCEYLGVKPYTPEEVTSWDLNERGLSDTPMNRLYVSMMTLFYRSNNDIEITDEQAAYINTHTDEFNGLCLEQTLGDWVIQRTRQTTAMEMNSGNVSQEKLFQSFVDKFASSLHDDTKIATYKTANTPTYNVKLDGENVVFTDNTVKAIKEWLDRFSPKNPAAGGFDLNDYNYMQIFGLEFGDDEEAIKSKLRAFCEKHGSGENMTVSLQDYYDTIVAANCTGSFNSRVLDSHSQYYKEYLEKYESIDIGNGYKLFILPVVDTYLDKDGQSFTVEGKATSDWPTYEQCGTIIKERRAELNALCKDNGLSTTPVSTTPRTVEEAVSGSQGKGPSRASGNKGNGSTNGTTPSNTNNSGASLNSSTWEPTMSVGGVIVDAGNYNKIKQEKLDEFLKLIEKFNNFEYKKPNYFGSEDIPIFAVEIDENGNVVIGDKFKQALKAYLQSLIDAEKYDIERRGSSGVFTQYGQPEFLNMLGLSEIPYSGGTHKSMYDWIDNIQSYIDDDSKLNQLVTAFCNSVGSVDGKTTTLENYYFAMADNNVHVTAPYQGTTFDDMNDIAIEAKINAYLEVLKEKYPEVYDEYVYSIQNVKTNTFGEMYYQNGQVRGDGYIHNIEAEDPYYSPQFMDVLKCAAGITGDELRSEQAAKMEALFKKMGAQGNYLEVDITDMVNYLLGDNKEGINYFDKLKSERNATANKVSNTAIETGTPDSSIKVEVYKPTEIQHVPEPNDVIKDITDFAKNLLDPIYAKYFATNGDGYLNFDLGKSDWSNPDSGDYAHTTWTWKDDATKEAFTKEVEAVIAQMLEKYSDVITNIMFDGQRIVYTTIYDDETPENAYTTINDAFLAGTTALNGMAHAVFGQILSPKGASIDPGEFEAAVENPISYAAAPKVISNNIPENAPVGVNGGNPAKTAWEGIWIDGDYIYLWDSKEQKYLAVKNYVSGANGGTFAQSLANGYTDGLPFGNSEDGGYLIDNILLSLVYGYNRTDVPNVFEKDGKYYTYDVNTKRHLSGLDGLEKMLNEITFDNTDTPVTQKAPAKQTPADDKTPEEVTIKVEDCLKEMDAAASKLNLSASKTQGVYYQFTNAGSYLYIWNPVEKKFKPFSINSRNADGTINQEFTQTGRAVNRTAQNIYYEAILEAYKNGFNFTINFPWICEKDGVYYEYDKEEGCFHKKETK